MVKKRVRTSKKKVIKNIPVAVAQIFSTFNNTRVTFTEPNGNVICWKSSGACGFKGTKKGTPFAAQLAAEQASKDAKEHGIHKVDAKIKGIGPGREAAIRAVYASGIEVLSIQDTTPIPHNGCRAPKRRRV